VKRWAEASVVVLLAASPGLGAPSKAAESWTPVDFATATCHYVSPPMELTFSIPPDFVARDAKHGPAAGCFWGTKEDLDRVLASSKGADFGKLHKGVFQAHVSTSSAYDPRSGKFTDGAQMLKSLSSSGITGGKVIPRQFGKYDGRVVTGKSKSGADLYFVYLAPALGTNAVLINYRPATPPTPGDAAVWNRFLDSIRPTK